MHSQRPHLLLTFLLCLLSLTFAQAQTPTASLTVSNALSCSQLSATLTAATSCTGAVSYRFSGPNDFLVETTSPVVSVTVDGEYTVVASNTATGCTATRSATLTSTLHPDYLPLVDLYRSTNGPNWENNTGWLGNCEPCSGWFGLQCRNNRVYFMRLEYNKLDGNIPETINKISKLEVMWVSNNRLKGRVPLSLYSLTELTHLSLETNQLSDTISTEVSKLSKLQSFRIFDNQFYGTIPESLSTLSYLDQLLLGHNQLTGKIPAGLTKLDKLQFLHLNDNQLTGPIPTGIGNLKRTLTWLDLSNNRLEGGIPDDISLLNNIDILFFSNNRLSGCFPSSLSSLCGKVRRISFYGNIGLPFNGNWSLFCQNGTGSDQFTLIEVSQFVIQSGKTASFTVSGGASYTWAAPVGVTLVSPAGAPSITALISGNSPLNFTLTSTNNYCLQTRIVSVTSVTHPDYISLADFFAATNGPNWINRTGWLSSLDPCSGWFGVSCQNDRVYSLYGVPN